MDDVVEKPIDLLLRDLRSGREGLGDREAARRLALWGPNEITRTGGPAWPRLLGAQLIHPLAVLLWLAAALAAATGQWAIAVAIVAVVLLNAGFAFLQERQAERAVEALAAFLPARVRVVRDGRACQRDATSLVPGDVIVVGEGDRISADARIISGDVEVDMSPLTGESVPVRRAATLGTAEQALVQARDMLFSGTHCTSGDARAVVVATGMATELGRIAALSERVGRDPSPLELQVRRVAIVIALVALGAGLLFLPLGLLAGLSAGEAVSFAIGLIVANVPEGLLPTITLALAMGVRLLAQHGALVKRLSAVETLGSTTVICTDKTGTLTENRMRPAGAWTADGRIDLEGALPVPARELARSIATSTAVVAGSADPTEIALLEAAERLGHAVRSGDAVRTFAFDPGLRRMSVVTGHPHGRVDAKGAPEAVIPLCTYLRTAAGDIPLDADGRRAADEALVQMASEGLRVLAVATRALAAGEALPDTREDADRDLTLLGLVGLLDPPRAAVTDAVARCHTAGVRIIVVTGDNGLTAAAIARRIGIPVHPFRGIVTGDQVDALPDPALDALLRDRRLAVVARTSPETKLRIAESLRAGGDVVAMTGDGVNDAPALRRADIGVSMGRSGTDVAREAATMILTDDDFGGIVTAIGSGRQAFANVRKFIVYIFAHAPAEVVPFLAFALSGGAIPLPLTVLQILAIDLGTETLPALALGREPAEPGIMDRPPRARGSGVIDRHLLARAWGVMGMTSAVLVTLGFLAVLMIGGWMPGDPVGEGTPLHQVYLAATATTFAGIVFCQVGTAVASRTESATLREIGMWSNPLLLWGIAFEMAFLGVLLYVPPIASVMHTAPLTWELLLILPFPVIVWAVDARVRRAQHRRPGGTAAEPPASPAA